MALADRMRTALELAYEDGRFLENFQKNAQIKSALELIKSRRYLHRLENPLLSTRVQALPSNYWQSF